MLPIAILPVAGLLLGLGSSFTNATTIATYGLQGILGEGTILHSLLIIMNKVGSAIFDNLPLIFAVGVAIGMAKKEKEVAALSALIAYFVMHISINGMLEISGKIMEDGSISKDVLEGTIASYVHNGGSIGVLVKLDTDINSDEVLAVGKDVAMQSAALNPAYVRPEEVPAEVIAKEKEIMLAQMAEDPKMANKPEQVRVKIVEGKVGKYYKENCLLEQAFVKDDKLSVQQYVDAEAKKLGGKISVVDVVRYECGEGVEKKEENFADEIAKMVK